MRTPCHLTSASHVRRALSFDKSLSHENPPYQLINLSRDKLPIIRDPLSHDNQAYHVISRPPPQGHFGTFLKKGYTYWDFESHMRHRTERTVQ